MKRIENNTGTMYLIQRKADGFFYKNGGGYLSVPEMGWSAQVAACRPFKTIGGAKTSRGWNEWKTTLTDDACEVCQKSKYNNYEHTFSERPYARHYGPNRRQIPNLDAWIAQKGRKPCFITSRWSEEENPRRIVPVRIQLALV
jgi:hypothetical protein